MTTLEDIKKLEQKIARLERSKALQKIKQRKQDTRKKIELGGLVIKANMNHYTKDIILGALIDARQQLQSSEETKRLFEIKGQNAFLEKE